MLHWGWESAAVSQEPWSVSCRRGEKGREGRGGGAPIREDAPLRLSLSPGRKCLVRLSSSSSSTWLHCPGRAPFRSCSVRPLRLPESSWAESERRESSWVFVPRQQQQTLWFLRWCADRQTKTQRRLQAGQKWHAALPDACDWLA